MDLITLACMHACLNSIESNLPMSSEQVMKLDSLYDDLLKLQQEVICNERIENE